MFHSTTSNAVTGALGKMHRMHDLRNGIRDASVIVNIIIRFIFLKSDKIGVLKKQKKNNIKTLNVLKVNLISKVKFPHSQNRTHTKKSKCPCALLCASQADGEAIKS